MTRYRSIIITDRTVQIFEHGEDIEQAEQFEYRQRAKDGIEVMSIGDIDGPVYTVVYYTTGTVKDKK